jgi:hypothetical protein
MTNLPGPNHSAEQFCWLLARGQGHRSLVPTSCWPPVIFGSPSAEKEQQPNVGISACTQSRNERKEMGRKNKRRQQSELSKV